MSLRSWGEIFPHSGGLGSYMTFLIHHYKQSCFQLSLPPFPHFARKMQVATKVILIRGSQKMLERQWGEGSPVSAWYNFLHFCKDHGFIFTLRSTCFFFGGGWWYYSVLPGKTPNFSIFLPSLFTREVPRMKFLFLKCGTWGYLSFFQLDWGR